MEKKDVLEYVVDGIDEEDCEAVHQHEMHMIDGNVGVKDIKLLQQLVDGDSHYTMDKYDEFLDGGDIVDHELLQVTCGTSATDLNPSMTSTLSILNNNSSDHNSNKTTICKRSTLKKSSTTSRESAKAFVSASCHMATPSSIKPKGDDFQLDRKSIAKFINQQTTFQGNSKYICNLCHKEYKQLTGLRNHVHVHSNWIRDNTKNSSKCDICFKNLSSPAMIERHMQMHEELPIFCKNCQKVFNSKSTLFRHRLSYQLRVYSCGVNACQKNFLTQRKLFTHMTKVHSNVTQPKYKCGKCATEYNNLDILHRHIQMTKHGVGNCSAANSGSDSSPSSAYDGTNIITLPNGLRIKFEGMVNE